MSEAAAAAAAPAAAMGVAFPAAAAWGKLLEGLAGDAVASHNAADAGFSLPLGFCVGSEANMQKARAFASTASGRRSQLVNTVRCGGSHKKKRGDDESEEGLAARRAAQPWSRRRHCFRCRENSTCQFVCNFSEPREDAVRKHAAFLTRNNIEAGQTLVLGLSEPLSGEKRLYVSKSIPHSCNPLGRRAKSRSGDHSVATIGRTIWNHLRGEPGASIKVLQAIAAARLDNKSLCAAENYWLVWRVR